MLPRIFIIGGPTASGKSWLALDLARRLNGEIINGDSMQAYSPLPILTAQPASGSDIPHHLYGVLSADETGSVAWWYENACKTIRDIVDRGKVPIVVGGTGLYLRTLTHGLSVIPEIPLSIRAQVRDTAKKLGKEQFYALVCHEDPKIKDTLFPNDTQRLCRALEVIRATQVSLVTHQNISHKIMEVDAQRFILLPLRSLLYERINSRFRKMVEEGALEEVKKLMSLNPSEASPLSKAIGVPELKAYLNGEISLEVAISMGQQSTRHYAKRQITWFTRQMHLSSDTHILDSPDAMDRLELLAKSG